MSRSLPLLPGGVAKRLSKVTKFTGRALPPNDPVAILGAQPLVNVQETDENYTMGQNDFAVIGTAECTVTLTPSPLAATPVLVVADGGAVTVEGGENTLQGGTVVLTQGSLGFFSFSPASAEWSSITTTGAGGGVTNVTGVSPIASSGGDTPAISFAIASQAQGDIVYFNGTHWVRLPAGTAGFVLTTEGTSANPEWAAVPASGGLNVVFVDTETFEAVANETLAVESSTGAISISIPVMALNDYVEVVDYDSDAQAHNISVSPPTGWQIMDPNTGAYAATNAAVVMNVNGGSATWASDGGLNNRLFII